MSNIHFTYHPSFYFDTLKNKVISAENYDENNKNIIVRSTVCFNIDSFESFIKKQEDKIVVIYVNRITGAPTGYSLEEGNAIRARII